MATHKKKIWKKEERMTAVGVGVQSHWPGKSLLEKCVS